MYNLIIKPFLFLLSPEKAHNFVFKSLAALSIIPGFKWLLSSVYTVKHPLLEREVFGIKFPNPVGLAAGFDKDAALFDTLFSFGFGFIEIGTITPLPQDGNPKPRMFRLPKDNALINRMGFNNKGLQHAVSQLNHRKAADIVGGNIGKNKITPNENATDDYEKSFNELHEYVDYFVVNVSSPNTPNLRELQEKKPLKALLGRLKGLNGQKAVQKPILLKIAPDLTNEQLDDIIEIVLETKIDGLIATNTTIDRSGLSYPQNKLEEIGKGGLSGDPVGRRSTEVIRYIHTHSKGSIPIIGVGGIRNAADAIEKLEAGASLIQLYTGFIYGGPSTVKRINKELIKYFQRSTQ